MFFNRVLDVNELELTLRWPRDMFVYEANQILKRSSHPAFTRRISALCGEAFGEADLEEHLEQTWPASSDLGSSLAATTFLTKLIEQADQFEEPTRRAYYAERHSKLESPRQMDALGYGLHRVVSEMSKSGYFPGLFPVICVDDDDPLQPDPSEKISAHIGHLITWPDDVSRNKLNGPVLYSVIEYLHDEAQRPQRRYYHNFGSCGMHYEDFSKRAGGMVYRWRVNELLEQHRVGLKLSNEGDEKGLLIRHAPWSLDSLAVDIAEATAEREPTETEKIESAVRSYRRRDATIHDRRAAIASLASVLEPRRQQFKEFQFAKGDESDLFRIFNTFSIRHGAKQKEDYGEEYLDWVFWTTLAAIQLVHRLGDASKPQS